MKGFSLHFLRVHHSILNWHSKSSGRIKRHAMFQPNSGHFSPRGLSKMKGIDVLWSYVGLGAYLVLKCYEDVLFLISFLGSENAQHYQFVGLNEFRWDEFYYYFKLSDSAKYGSDPLGEQEILQANTAGENISKRRTRHSPSELSPTCKRSLVLLISPL